MGWATDPRLPPRVGAAVPAAQVLEVGPDWVDIARRGGYTAEWGMGGDAGGGAVCVLSTGRATSLSVYC